MLMVELKMTDLPTEAVLPSTWFEVWGELTKEFQTKHQVKVHISGDIAKHLPNKNQFDALLKPININEKGKKTLSIQVKLDSPDVLLAGVRFHIDVRKKNQKETTAIKVMNRTVQVNRNMLAWVDVPLCDVEILKVAKSGLEMEVQTSNPQQNPIMISQIQLFCAQKKDFGFVEKV